MTCANYVCGSNENLKLCFQCDTLFCDNCAPAGTDFDDNIDPEEIYCCDCIPESEEEDSDDEDLCEECGDDESIEQCSECNTLFCPNHGPHYDDTVEPDDIYCSEKCYDKASAEILKDIPKFIDSCFEKNKTDIEELIQKLGRQKLEVLMTALAIA